MVPSVTEDTDRYFSMISAVPGLSTWTVLLVAALPVRILVVWSLVPMHLFIMDQGLKTS